MTDGTMGLAIFSLKQEMLCSQIKARKGVTHPLSLMW